EAERQASLTGLVAASEAKRSASVPEAKPPELAPDNTANIMLLLLMLGTVALFVFLVIRKRKA
ncbi:hypothetical protein COT29_03225, partial [Candidatus Micrarchaeota archaeon CG08_land_8_20_14_0_20_59_11]